MKKAELNKKFRKSSPLGSLEVKSLKSTIEDIREELERAEIDKSDLEAKISLDLLKK